MRSASYYKLFNGKLKTLYRVYNKFRLLILSITSQTWAQQQDILECHESQLTLNVAKDHSSSIAGQDDRSSFDSHDTHLFSSKFDFDSIILSSRIYRKVQRSHWRKAIRGEKAPEAVHNTLESSGSSQSSSSDERSLYTCGSNQQQSLYWSARSHPDTSSFMALSRAVPLQDRDESIIHRAATPRPMGGAIIPWAF